MRQIAKNGDGHLKAIVAEQRKEIARLQKTLAKLEVKKDSEISALKAKLAEEKRNKYKVIINDPCAQAGQGKL
jgi:hypothetical protein